MQALTLAGRYSRARHALFKWRYNLALPRKLALSFAMAALMALLAQLRIPLPWTPVPITGSTFGVVFAGVMLGDVWGGISMLVYILLGACGIPVFTGFKSGIAALAGPTGGYLAGFVVSAFLIGYLTENYLRARRFSALFNIMLLSNFIILTLGSIQLGLWLNVVVGKSAGFAEILRMGFLPFIPGDVIKSFTAALMAVALIPKEPYK